MTIKEILEATGGRLIYGNPGCAVLNGVSIDSRTISEGELFIAIKGQNFDGHDFLKDALMRGSGAVVSVPEPPYIKGKAVIRVDNTLRALQDMAHYARMKKGLIVIGVTGTNGKTTTKELTASVLGISRRVLKNAGNFNNEIGLPLSLLKRGIADDFAVLEMGAGRRGDIRELCRIADPDYGVITNVGPAHLAGFGNLDAVRDTKLELFDAVRVLSVNADDRFLMEGVLGKIKDRRTDDKGKIRTFGIENSADFFARDVTCGERYSLFDLCLGSGEYVNVRLNMPGRFNVYNALAAASVCSASGIGLSEIKAGIEAFKGVPMRLEFRSLHGVTVICDAYNANPASMREALKELVRLKKHRAVAMLGDMLELGTYAENAHRELGEWMAGLSIDLFIAVGKMMSVAAEEYSRSGKRAIIAKDSYEARKLFSDICREGDTVLIKGSRSMNMETITADRPDDACNTLRGAA